MGDMASIPAPGERTSELRHLFRLALPIVGANLGWMALALVDQIMLGRFDTQALAAAAVANIWIWGTLWMGNGLVVGIDPLVTQAHGARNGEALGRSLQWGLVVALAAGLLIAGLWEWTADFLEATGQEASLIPDAARYAGVQQASAPLFLCYVALRQYLQGREITRPAVVAMLVANVANVLLNWVLIYDELGVLGLRGMGLGVVGAGIATNITRSMMFVALLAIALRWRLFEGAWVPWSRESFALRGIRRILAHGLPTGLQMSLEVWAFLTATLMAGWLGADALAANAIVLNLSNLSFMMPLGISGAAATRVGNLIGAGKGLLARRAAWTALAMGGGVMTISALCFALLRQELPPLYAQRSEENAAVLALAASILPIAAAFQIFDGVQVVGTGVLRGMGRTLPAAMINLVGYWLLALPMAWWLTFRAGLGLAGVWWGLALGLALVAVGLLAWVRWRGPETVAVEELARALSADDAP